MITAIAVVFIIIHIETDKIRRHRGAKVQNLSTSARCRLVIFQRYICERLKMSEIINRAVRLDLAELEQGVKQALKRVTEARELSELEMEDVGGGSATRPLTTGYRPPELTLPK